MTTHSDKNNGELMPPFDESRSEAIESLLQWCRSKRLSLRDDIRNQQEAEWAGAEPFELGEEPGRAALHDAANFVADLGDYDFARELNAAAAEVAGSSSLPFLLRVEEWSRTQLSLITNTGSSVTHAGLPTIVDDLMSHVPKGGNTAMDIAIVIPLREEFDQLHNDICTDCVPEKNISTNTYDYIFARHGMNGDYRCVVTFVGSMGETKAGLATQQVLKKWNPKTIVVLGIAAGISTDVMVGDVVVASVVDSYLQNSKAVENGSGSYSFEHSGDPYRPSNVFVNETQHLQYAHMSKYASWRNDAQQYLLTQLDGLHVAMLVKKELLRLRPIAEVGHIASGPIVAAATDFIAEVKKKDRKYLALEMESGGVLAAVHETANPSHSLVIRGISDLGDGRKSELDSIRSGALRRYAVRNAIRFLWALIDCGAFPVSDSANPN